MKTKILSTLLYSAALVIPLAFSAGCEVSHTESDKPGWFGGRTHEETTVREYPDGSLSTDHSKQTVR